MGRERWRSGVLTGQEVQAPVELPVLQGALSANLIGLGRYLIQHLNTRTHKLSCTLVCVHAHAQSDIHPITTQLL